MGSVTAADDRGIPIRHDDGFTFTYSRPDFRKMWGLVEETARTVTAAELRPWHLCRLLGAQTFVRRVHHFHDSEGKAHVSINADWCGRYGDEVPADTPIGLYDRPEGYGRPAPSVGRAATGEAGTGQPGEGVGTGLPYPCRVWPLPWRWCTWSGRISKSIRSL